MLGCGRRAMQDLLSIVISSYYYLSLLKSRVSQMTFLLYYPCETWVITNSPVKTPTLSSCEVTQAHTNNFGLLVYKHNTQQSYIHVK